MKWRVALAVCFVLLLFAGFAYLYVNTYVRKHQHAIILFVVNGLDLNTLNLARLQSKNVSTLADSDDPAIGDARRLAATRDERLALDSFWNIAVLNVQQAGQPVPDEGADATAIACGQRVPNGCVATTPAGDVFTSLIYRAQKANRATGLVATDALVDFTPVAFYSSIRQRPDPEGKALDLVYSKIDIILGGGAQYFAPASATNQFGRTDSQDLFKAAADDGYTVLHTRDELNNLNTWLTPHLLGVFAPSQFDLSAQSAQPTLADMTRVAVSGLNKNLGGYFLVVEDGLVARTLAQPGASATDEVTQVDDAIRIAVEYAGPDALVVVTNSYNLGPNGPLATPAWLAARGNGAMQFRGFLNNTDVYDLINEEF
jgi:alkaline phosphatase